MPWTRPGPASSANPLVTLDLTGRRPPSGSPTPRRVWSPDPTRPSRVITHAFQVGSALLAAEQVGAAQHLLDLAVEYAKTRMQFGRPIGSFQAVKHKLADMLVDVEHARSTAYHAVWALTDDSDDPALAASIAQATSLGGVQPDRARHHPGARRHRVHLGAPGAPVLQTRGHRRRAARHCRAAPVRVAELVLDNAAADRAPWVATGHGPA